MKARKKKENFSREMERLLNVELMKKRSTSIEERYIWGERKVNNKCTNK
jgi:hypothetical protein